MDDELKNKSRIHTYERFGQTNDKDLEERIEIIHKLLKTCDSFFTVSVHPNTDTKELKVSVNLHSYDQKNIPALLDIIEDAIKNYRHAIEKGKL